MKQEFKDLLLILTNREEYKKLICERYKESITDFSDLLGDNYEEMSKLFYLYNRKYLYWLDNNPKVAVKEKDILFRRKFYNFLKIVGPKMLGCTQVFENRKKIDNPSCNLEDDKVILPDQPVIFIANHGFRDDVLATTLAAGRHAYLYCGSLPLFYNQVEGLATSLVGQIMVNRKSKDSRKASVDKCLEVMKYGSDIILFPEGGWNKTKEQLVLDLWKGVYKLSCLRKCDVVPISHYVRDLEIVDKNNIIHTVVDNPIPIYEMSEKEALQTLRDNLASWQYKMAEIYGKTTRDEELKGFKNSDEKWENHLKKRMVAVDRYDSTIEKVSDYRPKEKIRIEDVYKPISEISNITKENINEVSYAKKLVKEKEKTDFQRQF